jgi:hypothetical protein
MSFATFLLDVLVCAPNGLNVLTPALLDTILSVVWICLIVLNVTGIHCGIKGTTVVFSLKPRHSRSFRVWNTFPTGRRAE